MRIFLSGTNKGALPEPQLQTGKLFVSPHLASCKLGGFINCKIWVHLLAGLLASLFDCASCLHLVKGRGLWHISFTNCGVEDTRRVAENQRPELVWRS